VAIRTSAQSRRSCGEYYSREIITDCFERRNGEWKLIHQHASVPFGGGWDSKITTA
jgi:hypothetical protein